MTAPARARTQRTAARSAEGRTLSTAMPNIQRALQILAEREVAPQLGLLKSTLLQLDATFSERDFGAGSFLEFIQKLRKAGLVEMRRTDRGYLVEVLEGEAAREAPPRPWRKPSRQWRRSPRWRKARTATPLPLKLHLVKLP